MRQEKPAFIPFVIRSIPKLAIATFSAIFMYTWFAVVSNILPIHIDNPPTLSDPLGSPFSILVLIFLSLPILVEVIDAIRLILIFPNTNYAFTEKRVILKSGFFGIDYKVIDFDKISDLKVNVNPVEKLFSVGTIKIYSGRSSDKARKEIDDIIATKDPYNFFKTLKSTQVDIKTDWEYPNALRPENNPGYKTKYDKS